jgi:hypothetical protein
MELLELLEFSSMKLGDDIALILLLPKLRNFEKVWSKDPKSYNEAFELAMELEGIQEAIRGNVSSKRHFITKPQSNFKSETNDEKVFNSEMRIKKRKFKKTLERKERCFRMKVIHNEPIMIN